MALRRMFNREICHSGQQLKLSPTVRLLYQDLILEADDDGIVDAYVVMKMTGAKEGDLQTLYDKNLVVPLNNDLITYIPTWLQHNQLRSDRKTDSMYLPLLLKAFPDAEIKKSTKRADRADKVVKQETLALENDVKEVGRPIDSVVQYSIVQSSIEQQQQHNVADSQQIIDDVVDGTFEIDLQKEFDKRKIPVQLAVNWQQKFGKERILKQLYNYDLNKKTIEKPIAWLFNAIKNDYEVYGSQADVIRVENVKQIEQIQRDVEVEAESKQLTSVGEIIVHNKQLAAMAAKHVKVRLVENSN